MAAVLLVGCGPRIETLEIDGSRTVYPISEAVAEAYRAEPPGVRVTVGFSGTDEGLKKFAAGEIDLCGASRKVSDSEIQALKAAGVGFTRFTIAYNAIVVVVHPENDWVESLSVEQLESVWRSEDPVRKWNELDPAWPDEAIRLYGPASQSGSFEYFTQKIIGEKNDCRPDYTASGDEEVLVGGVSQEKHALGCFGYASYAEKTGRLKLLGVSQGADAVRPSAETIRTNAYAPLSQPLYLAARNVLLQRAEGARFVEYYLQHAGELAGEIGYVEVSEETAAENAAKLAAVAEGVERDPADEGPVAAPPGAR